MNVQAGERVTTGTHIAVQADAPVAPAEEHVVGVAVGAPRLVTGTCGGHE